MISRSTGKTISCKAGADCSSSRSRSSADIPQPLRQQQLACCHTFSASKCRWPVAGLSPFEQWLQQLQAELKACWQDGEWLAAEAGRLQAGHELARQCSARPGSSPGQLVQKAGAGQQWATPKRQRCNRLAGAAAKAAKEAAATAAVRHTVSILAEPPVNSISFSQSAFLPNQITEGCRTPPGSLWGCNFFGPSVKGPVRLRGNRGPTPGVLPA